MLEAVPASEFPMWAALIDIKAEEYKAAVKAAQDAAR